jgi:hypothetical protein
MSEMIERIAETMIKGMFAPHELPVPFDIGEKYRELARDVLMAMREPTDEMLHAATAQVPTWDDDASRRKWRAMIDAAFPRPDTT